MPKATRRSKTPRSSPRKPAVARSSKPAAPSTNGRHHPASNGAWEASDSPERLATAFGTDDEEHDPHAEVEVEPDHEEILDVDVVDTGSVDCIDDPVRMY
ncbi:MAG: hypothetical protein WD176_06915, partial [Pirellulales bacterium]